MPPSESFGTVVAIVARVLGVSSEAASTARRGEHEEWDSLKHIEIVFQVEEEFDLQFAEDDIADLTDVETIVAAVERVRGS
jgi:acyl carrier protein